MAHGTRYGQLAFPLSAAVVVKTCHREGRGSLPTRVHVAPVWLRPLGGSVSHVIAAVE